MNKNVILWDAGYHLSLLPFTYTRPVSELRCGILTITEKWQKYLSAHCSWKTEDYLSAKYPTQYTDDNVIINGAVLPTKELTEQITQLNIGNILTSKEGGFVATRLDKDSAESFFKQGGKVDATAILYPTVSVIDAVWKIFSLNAQEIESDFDLVTQGRTSQPIPSSNFIVNHNRIFLEEGAVVENASLNASSGAIYLGKDSEVMEGTIIRGAFALCEHSATKLATKIYGATTIGPHCKVGGEINNSVFYAYSNKAHDGFIGNAVIGEWCNIGADSNNSNLKNNYEEVKIWSYTKQGFMKTGLTFCGLFLGDHSKCGINTMFNTGTVVGVSANIFGAGFPRQFIPSFAWGGASGFTEYRFDKALETATKMMERRNLKPSDEDIAILQHIFNSTQNERNF